MDKLNIIGIGPGNSNFITPLGKDALQSSDLIIGSKRQLVSIEDIVDISNFKEIKKISELVKIVEQNTELNSISIVVSGDTGFYSILEYLLVNISKNHHEKICVVPCISSFQYLFAKLKRCWHNYILTSLHGRETDIVSILESSTKGVILLTDKKNNPISICKELIRNNKGEIKVIVGENLSYHNERIFQFYAKDFQKEKINIEEISVVVLEKRGEYNPYL